MTTEPHNSCQYDGHHYPEPDRSQQVVATSPSFVHNQGGTGFQCRDAFVERRDNLITTGLPHTGQAVLALETQRQYALIAGQYRRLRSRLAQYFRDTIVQGTTGTQGAKVDRL